MRWYLAGRMTGIPQFNFPAFDAATAHLRSLGHTVISPAELDFPKVRDAALASDDGELVDGAVAGESWGRILGRDVRVVADEVDGIVFLPAWDRSRGARLEAFVGLLTGKSFAYYDATNATGLYPIDADVVRRIIKENMP